MSGSPLFKASLAHGTAWRYHGLLVACGTWCRGCHLHRNHRTQVPPHGSHPPCGPGTCLRRTTPSPSPLAAQREQSRADSGTCRSGLPERPYPPWQSVLSARWPCLGGAEDTQGHSGSWPRALGVLEAGRLCAWGPCLLQVEPVLPKSCGFLLASAFAHRGGSLSAARLSPFPASCHHSPPSPRPL